MKGYLYQRIWQMFPFQEEYCRKQKRILSLLFVLCGAISVVFIVFNPRNEINIFLAVYTFVFLAGEMLNVFLSLREERMYLQMSILFDEIRHRYICCGNIADAVYEACDSIPIEARAHARKIYQILSSECPEDEQTEYIMRVHNHLYRMFVLQAVTLEEFGDGIGEASVFAENMVRLKREAKRCLRTRRKRSVFCYGLGIVCGAPVLCINWIQEWAVSNLPELTNFYYSVFGRMFQILILALSLGIYIALWRIRWPQKKKKEEDVTELLFLTKMVARLPGMNVNSLLHFYLDKSECYRKEIQRCIQESNTNPEEALLRMRKAATNDLFAKLVDLLILAEEMGVAEVFDEVDEYLTDYEKDRELSENISEGGWMDCTTLMSCIPGVVLLGVYLIFPFVTECFRQLEHYMDNLTNI